MSAYARQFLGQVDRPDVDFIEGLSPAVSIDQKSTNRNPRSTVGTITEIYDYMRLLWARIGVPHCPVCGEKIQRQTVQQIADQLMDSRERHAVPDRRARRLAEEGRVRRPLQGAAQGGYSRAIVDGEQIQLSEPPDRSRSRSSTTSRVVVDRLVAGDEILTRLTDSLETALRLTDGTRVDQLRRRRGRCRVAHRSPRSSRAPTTIRCSSPRSSRAPSRSTPRSARAPSARASAPACRWMPTSSSPTTRVSLAEGVILPWTNSGKGLFNYFEKLLDGLARDYDFSLDTPWGELSDDVHEAILHGNNFEVTVKWKNRFGREMRYSSGFEGVMPYIERKYLQAETDVQRQRFAAYLREIPCPVVRRQAAQARGARRDGRVDEASPTFASSASPKRTSSCTNSN